MLFSREQMEEMVHFPVYIGAAAGLGYEFSTGTDIDVEGVSYGGVKVLAVGLMGFELGWATATIYPGIIDNSFTVSGDFSFRLNDRMHLGIFWVPLLGLGASFTMAF